MMCLFHITSMQLRAVSCMVIAACISTAYLAINFICSHIFPSTMSANSSITTEEACSQGVLSDHAVCVETGGICSLERIQTKILAGGSL